MKNKLVFLFCIIVAIIAGTFLGEICADTPYLEWLGRSFAFSTGVYDLNLHFVKLTLGLDFSINLAQVLMLIIALYASPKVASKIQIG